jgi:hypothetical protein
MRTRTILLLLAIAVTVSDPVSAEPQSACATKPGTIAVKLDAKQAYDLAKAEATKSNADSVLLRLMTAMDGAVDVQGKSSAWTSEFYSATGHRMYLVALTSGRMECTPIPVTVPMSPQPIDETADTIMDTMRLAKIAAEHGGSKVDPKRAALSASLTRSGADTPAIWGMSYVTAQGMPVLQVMIDSKTGDVSAVYPPPR